jgi:hypothetical protein
MGVGVGPVLGRPTTSLSLSAAAAGAVDLNVPGVA